MSIEYKIASSSKEQIQSLLTNCDKYFVPKLSKKVNIEEYAKKIFDNAINFEAWNSDHLIGLIAMYVNTQDSLGYITNVSVNSEFANNGIASTLLTNCIEYAKEKNIDKINLEVNENNTNALKLYNKFKFEIYEEKESSKFMQLKLK